MNPATFTALTSGTAEFIASLPEQEKAAAWRAFLVYVELLKGRRPVRCSGRLAG